MLIFSIETSCDETAVAVINSTLPVDQRIIIQNIYSQVKQHEEFKGVVPELAARAHSLVLMPIIKQTLSKLDLTFDDMNAIAATAGPGLLGGVLVGYITAQAIALASNTPLIAVNHLEGHILTPRLTHNIEFPYLSLLVSGGHCQFVYVESLGKYEILGETLDDAAGEAFDKTAALLNLGFPGGPALEKIALQGDYRRFKFPMPIIERPGCDLSFSGLKTAVRQTIENNDTENFAVKADIAASFQYTVAKYLAKRTENAMNLCKRPFKHFVVVGGVAANQLIKSYLSEVCNKKGIKFLSPPLNLCTDNAAMIAWAGFERLQKGIVSKDYLPPRPRWPLTQLGFNNE